MPTPSKTVHVPIRGIDAMLELRERLKARGAATRPEEFRAIVEEELADTSEAYARGAVLAICTRVTLALSRDRDAPGRDR